MKILRYMMRELRTSLSLALTLPLFIRRRQRVRNAISIYLIVSSLVVRIGARLLHPWIKSRYVPIVVKFRGGPEIRYPLTAYLNHSDDFFTPYFDYYFNGFQRHFGARVEFEEGDVVIDIGAHIGSFSVLLAFAEPVRIIAVEPSRTNARYLRANVEKNGLADRVQVIEKAVSAGVDEAIFIEGDASTRGTLNTAMVRNPGAPTGRYVVDVVSFSDLMDAAGPGSKIRLVKMDCEGAEYEILHAMTPAQFANIEDMFLEVHRRDDLEETTDELIDLVRSMGFTIKKQDAGNGNWEVFCHRVD